MNDKIWTILLVCDKNKNHNIHIEQEIIEIMLAKTFYSPMFLFNKWRDYVNTKHIIHTDALSVTKISFRGGEWETASVNNICKTSSVCDQKWGNGWSNVATEGEDGMDTTVTTSTCVEDVPKWCQTEYLVKWSQECAEALRTLQCILYSFYHSSILMCMLAEEESPSCILVAATVLIISCVIRLIEQTGGHSATRGHTQLEVRRRKIWPGESIQR